jgi:hypothetical protein
LQWCPQATKYERHGVVVDVLSVTLYRFAGELQVTGYYLGYPVRVQVTAEKSLTLQAVDKIQLANMVNIASIDGWRVK